MTDRHPEWRGVFSYELYGLGVRSAFPLPEASPVELEETVQIRAGRVPHLSWRDAARDGSFRVSPTEAQLAWHEVASFRVRAGREITVDAAPGADARVVRLLLLGPVLAVLLHQRGLLVLHAGGVQTGRGAVLFLGGSGWGKSTLAAALHRRGHVLVTDDVAAVSTDGDIPLVLPGVPQLKLWPDSAQALGEAVDRLPPLDPRRDKRARATSGGPAPPPLPLGRLYVLADGETTGVEPLSPLEALPELVRHTFAARLVKDMRAGPHFRQCAALASRVPIRRLRVRRSLDRLPQLARIVEEDAVDAT